MVNEALVADSNSANDNFTFFIDKIERTPSGIIRLVLKDGPSFLCRSIFIPEPLNILLRTGYSLDQSELITIETAHLMYLAEAQAMRYLARAEHSAFLLKRKLIKKGFDEQIIHPVLIYLQDKKALDDKRYAESFLRNRSISKKEGSIKLHALLIERGVSSKISTEVLSSYFENTSEQLLCEQALEKEKRLGKSDDTIRRSLYRKGFTIRSINNALKTK